MLMIACLLDLANTCPVAGNGTEWLCSGGGLAYVTQKV